MTEYKASTEFVEDQIKAAAEPDDEDEKKDKDPKGFFKFDEMLNGKLDMSVFVEDVARLSPSNSTL